MLLACSDRMQWLEEQLRCERAFNEDLKARLHDLEAQNECRMLSSGRSLDCDTKRMDENSRKIVVRKLSCSLLLSARFYLLYIVYSVL